MIATFVTVWDGGTIIASPCQYDAGNRLVDGILTLEAPNVDSLDETYVELPDGSIIKDFFDDDNGIVYFDGQPDK